MILLNLFWTVLIVIGGIIVVFILFFIFYACYLAWKMDEAEHILHRDDFEGE